MLARLNKRVAAYAKTHQCTWSFALVVSVIRHQEVTIQTKYRKGRYDDLLRFLVVDDPSIQWDMKKDVFSSTHATVEDYILQWFPKNQQASYCEANDRWFRAKILLLGEQPVDLSYLNSGRTLAK